MDGLTLSHWGVNELHRDGDDRPVLAPWSGDPAPSAMGLYALDDVDRLRVRRPAIRAGWLRDRHSGQGRGHEPFIEVPWDEALDLVAAELARVRRRHGNAAMFGGSYGWASAGRFHHANGQLHRFLNTIGGYVRQTDSYSLGAGRVIMPHIVAGMDEIMQSMTSFVAMAAHTRLFVTFGGVPIKNTQISSGGAGAHAVAAGLRAMQAAGVRFVNISPTGDDLETGGPAEWIPIRPNTDTALMLALAFVLVEEGLHDPAFLDRCAVGFDRFLPYLRGVSDGQPKTPAWAAAITGVPAPRIVQLARDMASQRTMLNAVWSLQRASHGEQPFWMLVTLAAILGQIGLPGGGFGLGYGAMNAIGKNHVRLKGPTLPQGTNGVEAFIPCARLTDMLLRPGQPFRYNGGTHRYPDIRLVYWAGGNPFHHHQELPRLERAWTRPETVIVHEPYWTPTARRADIVLPVTTTLEREDIGYAAREGVVVAMRQARPPLGEARDDHAIFRALAERLDAGNAFTEGLDATGWQARMWEEFKDRAAAQHIELPDFAAFRAQGIVTLPRERDEPIFLSAFRADPNAHPLSTPSGRIEIYSTTIAGFGESGCGGHPRWYEPAEWLGNAAADQLHLLSDQPARRLHSQLDHSAHSREGKIDGREPLFLNPADAAARGIQAGDLVRLANERGACLAIAVLSPRIMRGVARLNTGAWYDPMAESHGTTLDRHGNPNVLTLDKGASGLSQGCTAQTCLVTVERYRQSPPRVRAHELPPFVERPAPEPAAEKG